MKNTMDFFKMLSTVHSMHTVLKTGNFPPHLSMQASDEMLNTMTVYRVLGMLHMHAIPDAQTC